MSTSSSKRSRPHPHRPRAVGPVSLAAGALLALAAAAPAAALEYTASVFASGLNNPRGLAFAPDGALWIAEIGAPGGGSGPSFLIRGVTYTYNESGSLTRVFGGVQERPAVGLPAMYAPSTGAVDSGLNAIAFDAGGQMSLLYGFGADPARRFTELAPVGFQFGQLVIQSRTVDVAAHETAFNPAGGPFDSNPWRVAEAPWGVLVTDAGANALIRVNPDGSTATHAVFPARDLGGPFPTESVTTGLAIGPDGAAYVGELTGFPFPAGAARVQRVAADGTVSLVAGGFTMIIDLAFDPSGDLLVLEYDSNGLIAPGTAAALWRLGGDGLRSLVWSDGLLQPTGLAVGPDGAYYLANRGAGGAGVGEVLRIAPVPEPATLLLWALGGAALLMRWRQRPR